MTTKQRKYLRVALWCHGICVGITPVFLLLSYLTRSWGVFRLGECLYRQVLHIYCPGCGGTRALSSLVRFDFWEAFTYCPALFLFVLVVIWMDTWIVLSILRKQERLLRFASPHIFWGVIGVAFVISIIRTVLAYSVGYDPLGNLTGEGNFFFPW